MAKTVLNRRQMLVRAAKTAAGLGLAVAISSAQRKAHAEVAGKPDPKTDSAVLNALLAAEYDAIATYSAGAAIIAGDAATPRATRDVVTDVAVHFQSQHQEHAAALKQMIEEYGGTPVVDGETAAIPASFPADAGTSDVLKLAADKEKAAAIAYANVMAGISSQAAAKLVAAIGAVETQHFVVLYLLVEGLIEANEGTAMNPKLVVPAAFVLDVGPEGSLSLENFPALDELLTLDAA